MSPALGAVVSVIRFFGGLERVLLPPARTERELREENHVMT
jgi:hypothetical protein